MSETVDQPQPTSEQDQSTENRQVSLSERTEEFLIKHKFGTALGIGQAISANVLIASPSLQDIIVHSLVGGALGIGVGSFIDHYENKSEARREERNAIREEQKQRRKFAESKPNNEGSSQ